MNRNQWLYLGTVILSLAWALLHPLSGTKIALVLVIITQLYLPGLLLARALGRLESHPIMRLLWILVGGLSLTVCLGAAARFLQVSIPLYLLVLHAIMLLLALRPAPAAPVDARWRLSRRDLPLYGLLVLSCVIVLLVGIDRNRFRFNGFEDQTVFVSLADWLANAPDDPGLLDRRIGVVNPDRRWETDGWTYTHAAWVWSSGVSAADLIWYDLTPLFMWLVPLVIFGLAYTLTRRESAAVWSAAMLTLAGLLTLDGLVYNPTVIAYGQFAVFQVNTLRAFSTALMLPLALMVALSYLRDTQRRDLLLIFLAGLALATMHPRQIAIFQISIGATAVLWWLSQPTRRRLLNAALLLVVLASLLVLPFIQRLNRPGAIERTQRIERNALNTDDSGEETEANAPDSLLVLENLPLLGSTYIMNPRTIFYHPLIILATLIGLGAVWWWRRSLAAQYLFASTAAMLVIFFVPGVTEVVAGIISLILLSGMIFLLPLALSLGLALDALLRQLRQSIAQPTAAFLAGLTMLALIFEPFPITASARDQIYASNSIQVTRDIQPFDTALLAELARVLPADQRSILMTPDHVANYIIESIPHTLITGGRASSNLAHPANARFFTQPGRGLNGIYPWLDSTDLDALREYDVTHIVIQASDSRLPQLLMQQERFVRIAQAAGYLIFAVRDTQPDTLDERFAAMNERYRLLEFPRWQPEGFALPLPADPDPWRELAQAWEAEPESDRARYGLAFTYVMMGEDEKALPLWQVLHEAYPDVTLFTDAVAHTRRMLDSSTAAVEPLLTALESDSAVTRIMVARSLLSETFLYLLNDEQIAQVLAVTQAEPLLWHQLAEFDQYRQVRERAALMLSAGQYDAAAAMIQRLPAVEISPDDLALLAEIDLVQSQRDAALVALSPATDPDWYAPNAQIHPDRWEINNAAQLYTLLTDQATPSDNHVSPTVIADSGQLFVLQPSITQDGSRLTVTATLNNPYPGFYLVQTWRVQVTNLDASQHYAEAQADVNFDAPLLTRANLTLNLPADLPALTPALVFIEPRHNDAVTYPTWTLPLVLNPPATAEKPADAIDMNTTFGESITLDSYTLAYNEDEIALTLYWKASQPLSEDYQVFVHVLDANGTPIVQDDAAPVNNRYPTSQWRANTLIADPHMLALPDSLPAGSYDIRIGFYRLSDETRLPISPADERVANDTLRIETITLP
ncbi:MAG: hypothetical protein K8L99_34180 [Anaerolineae bacterium]|nr:hypothetical protein [Anaerolineae bacterium]